MSWQYDSLVHCPLQETDTLVECCFTATETVGLLGTGAQDGHLDFHTVPELSKRHSKKTWCLTSTETVRFIRDGEKGMEMEGEGDYIPIATLSPPE